MASKEVTLALDGVAQTETLFFHAGAAGVKRIVFSLTSLPGEESAANNAMDRLVTVSGDKRRILYVEGEPRWEYKFLRRAAEGDHALQVVSMLRTTENKIFRPWGGSAGIVRARASGKPADELYSIWRRRKSWSRRSMR